jgi:hypothetical protein
MNLVEKRELAFVDFTESDAYTGGWQVREAFETGWQAAIDLLLATPPRAGSETTASAMPDWTADRADTLFDAVAGYSKALEGVDGVEDTGDNEEHTELARAHRLTLSHKSPSR